MLLLSFPSLSEVPDNGVLDQGLLESNHMVAGVVVILHESRGLRRLKPGHLLLLLGNGVLGGRVARPKTGLYYRLRLPSELLWDHQSIFRAHSKWGKLALLVRG